MLAVSCGIPPAPPPHWTHALLPRSLLVQTITLCMLPVSCIMVGYAIYLHLWRSRRLYRPNQRFKPYHDAFGPNMMALIIIIMFVAVLLVTLADLAILLKKARKHHPDVPPLPPVFPPGLLPPAPPPPTSVGAPTWRRGGTMHWGDALPPAPPAPPRNVHDLL